MIHYRPCVGLPFVSCRRLLDPLVSPLRLHRLPLSSSTPIRGSLSSGLISRTAQRSSYLTFSPSQPMYLAGTMASADSCRLSLASRPGLPLVMARRQVSPGKNVDFPCTLAPFTALALDCIGLHCPLPTRPTAQPPMRFVFLKSQVCLRLPSDPASRRRPCPWLTVGAINLRTGLSPSSQRPCWAHKGKNRPARPILN
jgi:hypothetical protein